MATILVVDDEPRIARLVSDYLNQAGFRAVEAHDGRSAIRAYSAHRPDLLVLDLGLPGMDGLDVIREIRLRSDVPIIIVSARSEETDRVVGLELGADDYLTKPFSMRELMARVKAQLRRVELTRGEMNAGRAGGSDVDTGATLTFEDLVIDQARREVRLGGRPLHLKPKEYELLLFLARNRGIALSRDLILERVWDWHHEGSSRTVDVHVRWLREKIEPDPANSRRIATVRGLGYRFDG